MGNLNNIINNLKNHFANDILPLDNSFLESNSMVKLNDKMGNAAFINALRKCSWVNISSAYDTNEEPIPNLEFLAILDDTIEKVQKQIPIISVRALKKENVQKEVYALLDRIQNSLVKIDVWLEKEYKLPKGANFNPHLQKQPDLKERSEKLLEIQKSLNEFLAVVETTAPNSQLQPQPNPGQNQSVSRTLEVNSTDGGTATGGGTYEKDARVTVSAKPNSGYRFVNWTKDGQASCPSPDYTFYMPAENVVLTANFEEKAPAIPKKLLAWGSVAIVVVVLLVKLCSGKGDGTPNCPECKTWLNQGDSLMNKHKFKEAEAAYLKAKSQMPDLVKDRIGELHKTAVKVLTDSANNAKTPENAISLLDETRQYGNNPGNAIKPHQDQMIAKQEADAAAAARKKEEEAKKKQAEADKEAADKKTQDKSTTTSATSHTSQTANSSTCYVTITDYNQTKTVDELLETIENDLINPDGITKQSLETVRAYCDMIIKEQVGCPVSQDQKNKATELRTKEPVKIKAASR